MEDMRREVKDLIEFYERRLLNNASLERAVQTREALADAANMATVYMGLLNIQRNM